MTEKKPSIISNIKKGISKITSNAVNLPFSKKKGMKAVILGATGLTGGHLLNQLLEDNDFRKVVVLTRSNLELKHPKLEEHLVDLLNMEEQAKLFKADVVFCCVGTTRAKTPDKDLYRRIDYGIPVEAARLAKQQNVNKYIVISAIGANPKSNAFYNRLKGEMERDVLTENIEETYLLQPSLIVGDRNEKRFGEDSAKVIMRIFDFLIPKKQKMIQAATIAKAMVYLAKNKHDNNIIPSDQIKDLAKVSKV